MRATRLFIKALPPLKLAAGVALHPLCVGYSEIIVGLRG